MQDFADSWLDDQYVVFFMKLSGPDRSKGSPLQISRILFFSWKLHNKYRTIDVFFRTIRPSSPAKFQFFPALPIRILGYYGGFHLERRSNVSLGVDDDTHAMCLSFTVLLC